MSLAPSSSPENFLELVIARKPRLAVFDCDGTLWSGDAGAGFFYWEIEKGLLPKPVAEWAQSRYADYLAGKVDELTICGEMVTIHDGISLDLIRNSAREFFAAQYEQRIFPEMQRLVHLLQKEGCEIWACSSTNDWVIEAGVESFGIPRNRILAASVKTRDNLATGELIRVPTDELKATAINEVLGSTPDAVFGNSMHDLAMLELAREPYAINPNTALELEASVRGWSVYWPEAVRVKETGK